MSLVGRFDSRFMIFRGDNTTDDFGDAAFKSPTLVGEYDGLMTSPHDIMLGEDGAGEYKKGYRTIIFDYDTPIEDNDIIYSRVGPEQGSWWRFQHTQSQHGRHREGYVLPYRGQKVNIDA